ncbi:MAG: Gfo/Idh/MocA family oxidoreductase [Actinobacteria bacterium]|nr:Gfo/Idh/MocA family oxidoreductase [Actinomycetota bacterium]
MKRLRVGVVGLGFIGALHARAFAECPNAELVAVTDLDATRSSEISSRHACHDYPDLETMLQKETLDAVAICSPDPTHRDVAVQAAQHGLDILLEKPIATTAADALAITQAVDAAGTRMMVAHLLHFDPRYAILKQSARRGELGEIVHLHFRRTNPRTNGRRLGGTSIFWYIGIHDFEMMLTCARATPVRAYAQAVSKINADIGCEDSVFATITFDNGAIGMIELSWALPENTALGINTYAEVVGTKAVGYVTVFDQGISFYSDHAVRFPDALHWPEYNGQIQGDLRHEIQHFVDATLNGRPYVVETDTAIQSVKVVEACQESIRSGLPVDIT